MLGFLLAKLLVWNFFRPVSMAGTNEVNVNESRVTTFSLIFCLIRSLVLAQLLWVLV